MSKPYSDYVSEEAVVELRRMRERLDRATLYLAVIAGMGIGGLVGLTFAGAVKLYLYSQLF